MNRKTFVASIGGAAAVAAVPVAGLAFPQSATPTLKPFIPRGIIVKSETFRTNVDEFGPMAVYRIRFAPVPQVFADFNPEPNRPFISLVKTSVDNPLVEECAFLYAYQTFAIGARDEGLLRRAIRDGCVLPRFELGGSPVEMIDRAYDATRSFVDMLYMQAALAELEYSDADFRKNTDMQRKIARAYTLGREWKARDGR